MTGGLQECLHCDFDPVRSADLLTGLMQNTDDAA
jgi:hypothetical protein